MALRVPQVLVIGRGVHPKTDGRVGPWVTASTVPTSPPVDPSGPSRPHPRRPRRGTLPVRPGTVDRSPSRSATTREQTGGPVRDRHPRSLDPGNETREKSLEIVLFGPH